MVGEGVRKIPGGLRWEVPYASQVDAEAETPILWPPDANN